jgi:hypothetical protein
VEWFINAYETMLDRRPALPFSAQDLYTHSMDMGPKYRRYLRDNDAYSTYLDQLRSAETAMLSAYRAVSTGNAINPTATLQALKDRIDSLMSARTDRYALLYKDELDARIARIRAKENVELAPAFSADISARPLSAEEEYAITEGELDEYEDRLGTTVDWLEKVPGLRIPDSPDEPIGGIFRVIGDIGAMDFFLFGVPTSNPVTREENVIVGIAGEGREVTTGMGHDVGYPVVPLNAPAFKRLGGSTELLGRFLNPVLKKELLGEATAPAPAD